MHPLPVLSRLDDATARAPGWWTDSPRTRRQFHGDLQALSRQLEQRVSGEVRFDRQSRSLYAVDASNYRQLPLGVVLPHDTEDLVAAVEVCRDHGAPITHRGGGTGLAGQTANACVVIDSSKYLNRIYEIDAERRVARVQPGVRRDQLADRAEAECGLTFGPDTSTHLWATLGGMIGNNSCGMHSEMAGKTVENVEELDILLYDGTRLTVGATSEEDLRATVAAGGRRGEIYERLRDLRDRYADLIHERYPDIPRRVSGYNLDELLPEKGFHVARSLVGTEGTCVTVLEAKLRLVPFPPAAVLVVLGFADIVAAGHAVAEIKTFRPAAIEGLDDVLIDDLELNNLHPGARERLPEGGGWLMVEFRGDTRAEAEERAQALVQRFRREDVDARIIGDPAEQEKLWAVREAGLGATARVPSQPDTWEGWEDSACPPDRLGDYLRDLRRLCKEYGFRASLYGHLGQGCVHTRIPFDLTSAAGIRQYRQFIYEAAELCVSYGGSLSAEHGDGQSRGELLPLMFGDELCQAFREFKEIWDPDWKMNPGKVVEPFRLEENLRLGAGYAPPELETHFAFPEDEGSFHRAVLRCVGVGKCRRMKLAEGEVMCPSYVVTREEKHTTRGRARLLFEMLNSEHAPGAWDDPDVEDALSLCLSCKGCKNDCPVSVDMATYKAEFLSHYYEHHLRPRHAHAFGQIHRWARLAARMPRVANFFSRTPGFDRATKALAGIAQEREVPAFATETFRDWFERRPADGGEAGTPHVLLWADTFTNFLTPEIGRAAVHVLEEAGFRIRVPHPPLCCGRPLYEFGWVEQAKGLWRQTLLTLRDEIRAGTPVIGLEPSCTTAFHDELPNLFPGDLDAQRLRKQTFTLGEFLETQVAGYEPPRLSARALLHGHCHQKSIIGISSERLLLERMGIACEVPPAPCCGMAGAFGFEAAKYDVSVQVGEYALLPAIREKPSDALIIADGFSCREQIRQLTDRRALHLAQVLHLASSDAPERVEYPERAYAEMAGGSA
jgi:FAD/FMN-containing dehydrogenase/Fe-S oxidoreductase